jgi:hypothetical protein
MKKIFDKKQNGYAILFTVIIVSVLSVITAGIINGTNKQLILSSLANDSQTAFYQADTAADCGIYADQVLSVLEPDILTSGGEWFCNDVVLRINPTDDGYEISPGDINPSLPCFKVIVTKDEDSGTTEIKAKGYNICNEESIKTVEREISISFSN